MKYSFNKLSLAVLAINLIFLVSCKKDENLSSQSSEFSWEFRNAKHKAIIDTAFLSTQYFGIDIRASTTSDFKPQQIGPTIYLKYYEPGAYSLDVRSSNLLNYYDELGIQWIGMDGALEITSNSNNSLSGKFAATMSNSITDTLSFISGSFKNVPIKH